MTVFTVKPTEACTQRNIYKISLNQTEIRLYLPFSDWFGAANGHYLFGVPNQSENSKYNLISVWFYKISKIFPCVYSAVARTKDMQAILRTIVLLLVVEIPRLTSILLISCDKEIVIGKWWLPLRWEKYISYSF